MLANGRSTPFNHHRPSAQPLPNNRSNEEQRLTLISPCILACGIIFAAASFCLLVTALTQTFFTIDGIVVKLMNGGIYESDIKTVRKACLALTVLAMIFVGLGLVLYSMLICHLRNVTSSVTASAATSISRLAQLCAALFLIATVFVLVVPIVFQQRIHALCTDSDRFGSGLSYDVGLGFSLMWVSFVITFIPFVFIKAILQTIKTAQTHHDNNYENNHNHVHISVSSSCPPAASSSAPLPPAIMPAATAPLAPPPPYVAERQSFDDTNFVQTTHYHAANAAAVAATTECEPPPPYLASVPVLLQHQTVMMPSINTCVQCRQPAAALSNKHMCAQCSFQNKFGRNTSTHSMACGTSRTHMSSSSSISPLYVASSSSSSAPGGLLPLQLPVPHVFCTSCNIENVAHASFCFQCGHAIGRNTR